MIPIFHRRPALSVFIVTTLILIYLISLIRNPSVDTPPTSWSHSWPDTWFNGAPPPPETDDDAFPAADPLAIDDAPVKGNTSGKPNEIDFAFQKDIPNPQPSLDLTTLSRYRPHNLKPNGKHPTFATFYSTRNASLHDPYFIATQHLIYRILWSPTTASPIHPFTVFVSPFIPENHRAIFRGAGANVVELPLVEWHPSQATYAHWRDLFSKLHMWNQTQFTLISFLDSDAFPIRNIDDIFTLSTPQTCVTDKLNEELALIDEICTYVFAGVEIFATAEVNAGVVVLAPNKAMHARLLRNVAQTDQFDSSVVEQGFFNWQFNAVGPFPSAFLPRAYNGFFPQPDEQEELKVVHEKLWVTDLWGMEIFDKTHREMLAWFDSPEFLVERERDGSVGSE